MEKEDIEKFKRILLKMKRDHIKERKTLEEEYLRQSTRNQAANLSAYPLHTADISGDIYEQEKEIAVIENISEIMHKIDEALHRIDTGKYGICEKCGKEIPKTRLEIIPFTKFCISCSRK
ncbi:TPA: hypothetical protein DCX16_02700 [bacterium]|nr:hypothetical protein [bacterium]